MNTAHHHQDKGEMPSTEETSMMLLQGRKFLTRNLEPMLLLTGACDSDNPAVSPEGFSPGHVHSDSGTPKNDNRTLGVKGLHPVLFSWWQIRSWHPVCLRASLHAASQYLPLGLSASWQPLPPL